MLERQILDQLDEIHGVFVLHAVRTPALRRAIDRAMSGPRAREELWRALQIVEALDSELCSPAASDTLAALLGEDPRVRALIEAVSKESLEEAHALRRREGRDIDLRAPVVDQPPAPTAIPLNRLWNAARGQVPRTAERELTTRRVAEVRR